jgi:hypothetical protein
VRAGKYLAFDFNFGRLMLIWWRLFLVFLIESGPVAAADVVAAATAAWHPPAQSGLTDWLREWTFSRAVLVLLLHGDVSLLWLGNFIWLSKWGKRLVCLRAKSFILMKSQAEILRLWWFFFVVGDKPRMLLRIYQNTCCIGH